MAVVRVVLSTAVRTFPFGTQAGPLKVTLTSEAGEATFLEQEASPFVFEDVAVGNYTVMAERMDGAGGRLGDAIVQPFSVNPTSTEVIVPINMVVTQE